MTATYSPEDNKLRLYSVARLGADTYGRVKAAGFKWAPKQELFVAPAWSPDREDLLLELCGEIGDEDYSATERAADRADRFSDYRDRRAGEAGARADHFEAGPATFGHQSRGRAERQAERHDRHRRCAVSQWSKAEYWQTRTKAVIEHALFRASAGVRRGRILRLEAEQRKHEKGRAEYATRFAAWSKVPALEGAALPIKTDERPGFIGYDAAAITPAGKLAYALANTGGCGWSYPHPRTGEKSSLYSHLTNKVDPITPAEAAALWLDGKADPADPDSGSARWSDHYSNRLAYERAMLEQEGGAASAVEMEPGGWIKGLQIHGVNRSPATGRVVSVKLMGEKGKLVSRNIERLPEGVYRAPTEEERAAFLEQTAQRKAAEKAVKPKAPPLVNPTDEDAEKLQALWNERAAATHKAKRAFGECPVSTVWRMTQAEYSARSKGSYGTCETSDVSKQTRIMGMNERGGRVCVFKVRTGSPGASSFSACRRVVVLSDKPRKAIPWEAVEAAKAEQPTCESLFPLLGDIVAALQVPWSDTRTPEEKRLVADARYVGWAWESSATQRGLTEAGIEAYRRFQAAQPETVAV